MKRAIKDSLLQRYPDTSTGMAHHFHRRDGGRSLAIGDVLSNDARRYKHSTIKHRAPPERDLVASLGWQL
jgi:hypothetical protein